MLSGRKALSSIEETLRTVRNEAVNLDQQLSRLVGQKTMNERHRLSLLTKIASVRLNEIESGELASVFDAIDARVEKTLLQREAAFTELAAQIKKLYARIQDREVEREELLDLNSLTSQKLVDVEAKVQAQLKVDQTYLRQFEVSQRAESVSEEAEFKVEQATVDMANKAKPYKADALFMYLWNRSYGTTKYNSGLLSRVIDDWLARLIKFEPARVNFWNLTEIPKRLTEHADRVADEADRAMMALQQLEQDALESSGAAQLEAELEALRAKLDLHDDETEVLETTLNDALEKRAIFNTGGDHFTQECLDQLTSALEHQGLTSINRYVRQTHSPTDDMLVIELQELEDDLNSIDGDLSNIRKLHDVQINKLREIETVRQQFKNSRFDDVRSGFTNSVLISRVLTQFMQGALSGGDVWGTFKRNQRYQNVGSSPDFGSGGLGGLADVLGRQSSGGVLRQGRTRRRKRKGSSWHIPTPRRNGGGFQFPRSVGRTGNGGFKTGGGF